MSSVKRAWTAAAGVGVVEALKDQMGFCRWNYAIRSINHQHAKNNLGMFSQANKLSSPAVMRTEDQERAKQSEESLRKVMYLSCWGPN
ncbi:uncharacterized protein LOC124940433 [Impatiens glandulifera]|uniref:uncharacterized protein LOC124940433 n=1 Tax=Impatiens glandulifera TaxID=253017 RepID=UPI001FB0BF9C|nr:uncharacterized protein LOC124940433 [Impatiens glandulifera]